MELNLPMTAEELAAERRMLERLPPPKSVRPVNESKEKAPAEPAKPNKK